MMAGCTRDTVLPVNRKFPAADAGSACSSSGARKTAAAAAPVTPCCCVWLCSCSVLLEALPTTQTGISHQMTAMTYNANTESFIARSNAHGAGMFSDHREPRKG